MTVGFIGLGNMAKAMIGGMLAGKLAEPADIVGSARTEATRRKMKETYGITVTEDNGQAAEKADVLILAVKPQMFEEVIPQIREKIKEDTLIISIAPAPAAAPCSL